MNKKELSAIPRPEPKAKYGKLITDKLYGIATIDVMEISGQQLLVMNCFDRNLRPWFRVFCSEDDYITQDLMTENIRWKTGSLEHIAGYYIAYRGKGAVNRIVLGERGDLKKVKEFFKPWLLNHEYKGDFKEFRFDDYIDKYQQKIREKRLFEKHRKEIEETDRYMELFGDIPDDYDNFVRNVVFDEYNFFFYDRKKKWAYCTRCGFEYEIRKDGVYHKKIGIWTNGMPRHNDDYVCPHCGKFITAKAAGRGRKYMEKPSWSVLVQANGEKVLTRYFLHTKSFKEDMLRPKIKTYEKLRTVHMEQKQEDYEWSYNDYVKEYRWNHPKRTMFWDPSEYTWPRSTTLYNKDFEVLKGTCMNYSCMTEFIVNVFPMVENNRAFLVDSYLDFYRHHKSIEQIIKIGWYKLAAEFVKNAERPLFMSITDGRTVLESLDITREQFLQLKKVCNNNPTERDIQILKYAKGRETRLRDEEFEKIRFKDDYKQFVDYMRCTTLHKLEKYLKKNGKVMRHVDYWDYLRWIEEMGYDMRNEFNLYPKDFVKKHDEKSAEYLRWKEKKHNEDVKKFNRLLKKMKKNLTEDNPARMTVDGLFIRLPYSVNELKKEGEFLHHCVGTYAEKVMKGETSIFFIRRISDPDSPYYTLEWRNHKIAQCRGMRNCGMTPEVKAFSVLFEEKMKEYEITSKKKAG